MRQGLLKSVSIAPLIIFTVFCIIPFVVSSQQDSQEFLIYLLEGLHEDVNRVTTKKKHIITDDEGEEKISASEKATQMWKRYLDRDNSKIVGKFF